MVTPQVGFPHSLEQMQPLAETRRQMALGGKAEMIAPGISCTLSAQPTFFA